MAEFIVHGKLYNTETSTEICSNEYRDGTNRMNHGRATTLYKTPKGAYWFLNETCCQGETDTAEPISKPAAAEFSEVQMNARGYALEFGEPEEA